MIHGSRVNRAGEFVLLGVVMLFGIAFLWSLKGLNFEAQLFPFVISCLMLGLATARLISLVVGRRAATCNDPVGQIALDDGSQRMSPILVWSWAVGTVATMIWIGFVAGTALSVFVYPLLAARRAQSASLIARSLGIAAAVTLFVFVVFGKVMHIALG